MLVSFARASVTRLRAPMVVDHGAEVRDWSKAVPAVVSGCLIDSAAGARDTAGRDGSQVALVVLAPPGSDVQAGDRFTVDGYVGTFDLAGPPRRQGSPTGRLAHIQLDLKAWEG